MVPDGFKVYRAFCKRPPQLVLHWHDSRTEAQGWLVINSLKNGASGGGTRMRKGATLEEAIFLAKTMEIKFMVSGPLIGGAKSVIDFDPQAPEKKDVLKRWFESTYPYLKHCYGTGGDLGVDEMKEVIPISQGLFGIEHPLEGMLRGHVRTDEEGYRHIFENLHSGVKMEVPLEGLPSGGFTVADMVTGYGLSRALHHFFELRGESPQGKKALVEGFGTVGGSAAYYLDLLGMKIVGILSMGTKPGQWRCAIDPQGLDVRGLLLQREGKNLPPSFQRDRYPEEFWRTEAEVFVPAAASHTVTMEVLSVLKEAGVEVIAPGANDPFADTVLGATEVQEEADRHFAVIPDFIANSGMARTFAYLMREDATVDPQKIYQDVDEMMGTVMEALLKGSREDRHLLNRAYSMLLHGELEGR